MAIEGPLRELGIHDVFQLLDLSRKTGVLRVTSELRHNAGTIYFQDGTIIFAEIKSNPHPLGALLLRTGKITEADLERARDMQTRQNDPRRLGQILVAMGVLSPREVERQVRFQIEEVVFEVMSWREGFFSFSEEPVSGVPAETTVSISTGALLMEGARRIDEWSRIEKHVPHLGVVPQLARAPRTRSRAGTWSRRARWPSRRPRSTRTTRQATCHSAGSASPRCGRGRRWTSCGARCGSIPCSRRRTGSSGTRSRRSGGSGKRGISGSSGSGSPRARRRSPRGSKRCDAPRRRRRRSPRRGRGAMADGVKALSAPLAQDPASL